MTRCPPLCGRNKKKEKQQRKEKVRRGEKKKEDMIEELVLRKFWKWKKVFGKAESERMPVQKTWDHAIEPKEGFAPRKRKVYPLSIEEREKVQAFVEDQL